MTDLVELAETRYLGNDLTQWGSALAIALVALVIGLIARRIIRTNYARMGTTERTEFLELPLKVASRTSTLFLVVLRYSSAR